MKNVNRVPPRGKGLALKLCAPHSKAKRRLAHPPRGGAPQKRKPTYPTTKPPTQPGARAYRTCCLPTFFYVLTRALRTRAHSYPQHWHLWHKSGYWFSSASSSSDKSRVQACRCIFLNMAREVSSCGPGGSRGFQGPKRSQTRFITPRG